MDPEAWSLLEGFVCPLPGAGRPGLVQPVPVDPSGRRGPTANQSRGPRWRRTSRGLFVPAETPRSPEQRILEASMVLPIQSGITGWAALRWAGGRWFEGVDRHGSELPVPLLAGERRIRPQPGFSLVEERRCLAHFRVVDGVASVDSTHATAFAMRYASAEREAAVAFEMAAYNDLVSRAEISLLLSRMNGWTGVPQARAVLAHLDENAWSPQETRLRLAWMLDAGLPPPLTNHPVFDRQGRHLGTPDLLDEQAGLVVEYDGAQHLNRNRRASDLRREARFRTAGLEYLSVVSLAPQERRELVRLLRETRARARFAAPSTRAWTTRLPSWWIPTFTVDQRRELNSQERDRWLHLRRQAAA